MVGLRAHRLWGMVLWSRGRRTGVGDCCPVCRVVCCVLGAVGVGTLSRREKVEHHRLFASTQHVHVTGPGVAAVCEVWVRGAKREQMREICAKFCSFRSKCTKCRGQGKRAKCLSLADPYYPPMAPLFPRRAQPRSAPARTSERDSCRPSTALRNKQERARCCTPVVVPTLSGPEKRPNGHPEATRRRGGSACTAKRANDTHKTSGTRRRRRARRSRVAGPGSCPLALAEARTPKGAAGGACIHARPE